MGIRHDLQRSIHQIVSRDKSGSFATQAARLCILKQFAADLVKLGFGLRNIQGLKQKHIESMIEYWKGKNLANATLKNRMSVLRFLCEKINKASVIVSNKDLKIAARNYKPTINKAIYSPNFDKVTDQHVRISLELQRVFGLRREEALKIKPHLADKCKSLELLPTWCKGGRGRFVPIRTEEQRYWLSQAKQLVAYGKSLIPERKSYIQHREVYDKQVSRAGLKRLHGLRHAYAQIRYKELTGWEASINGGCRSKELTKEQKEIDYQARMILTEELGHSREQITVNYLGR